MLEDLIDIGTHYVALFVAMLVYVAAAGIAFGVPAVAIAMLFGAF